MRIRRSARLAKSNDKFDVPSSQQHTLSSNKEPTRENEEQRRKNGSTRDKKKQKKKMVHGVVDKPIGKPVRISGKGKGKKYHYRSFQYNDNHYDLEDFVLHHPEKEREEPYVAIIRDITQTIDDNMIIKVQWFYRSDDTKKKGGGKWESNNVREIFYSFHKDEVPAESVIQKCEVHFVPLNKQIPSRKQHPGFIVQKVYNPKERRLSNITNKSYAKNNREKIDLLIRNTMSRLGELPDQNEQLKKKRCSKK